MGSHGHCMSTHPERCCICPVLTDQPHADFSLNILRIFVKSCEGMKLCDSFKRLVLPGRTLRMTFVACIGLSGFAFLII